MQQTISLKSAQDFQSAFRVAPDIASEAALPGSVGIYTWSTPSIDGFELPECDDLVIAMHLGGSRQVRAITERGPSRSRSLPGRLTILPAGRSAAFQTDGSIHLVSLHVSRGTFAQEWLDSPRFAFQDAFASAAMEALLNAAREARGKQSEYIARISGTLLYHLAQSCGAFGPALLSPANSGDDWPRPSDPLARILGYIDTNLGGKLDIEELAEHAGLSRATLARKFHQLIGLSPHQYIMARRVEAARAMLRNSKLDLSLIAQELGFASQSHFTQIFHSATGCTPKQFRQRC
jgi:AraC family transcriptional regulator